MERNVCAGLRDDLKKMERLVARQLQDALKAFVELDLDDAGRIAERDDIVDNLNLHIEELAQSVPVSQLQSDDARFVRSAVKVALNLERIGDAACHIARRVDIALSEGHRYVQFDMEEMEAIALAAVRESVASYLDQDIHMAESACLREPQLDAVYVRKIHELESRMRNEPDNIPFFLYWNSVLKYLEKVCDYTLNIGEQAIFLVTGRRLKFAQYQQLDRLVSASANGALAFSPYYDGLSGAAVARLSDGEQTVVFKQGSRKKIEAEADKLREWQRLFPSLTPRIIATDRQGDREALLREFVSGVLLSDIYLSLRLLEDKLQATRDLFSLTLDIWRVTMEQGKPSTCFAGQIRSRLSEVYAMHPYLEFVSDREGLGDLLDAMEEREQAISPDFQVWLHGDFNMNNVVYRDGSIRFIDVHRSTYGDYLGDTGVFLVSTVRQPQIEEPVREQLRGICRLVREYVEAFAREQGDVHYHERLQMSLARSYLTSARVVVDEGHARWLFERGIRLLRKEAPVS